MACDAYVSRKFGASVTWRCHVCQKAVNIEDPRDIAKHEPCGGSTVLPVDMERDDGFQWNRMRYLVRGMNILALLPNGEMFRTNGLVALSLGRDFRGIVYAVLHYEGGEKVELRSSLSDVREALANTTTPSKGNGQ